MFKQSTLFLRITLYIHNWNESIARQNTLQYDIEFQICKSIHYNMVQIISLYLSQYFNNDENLLKIILCYGSRYLKMEIYSRNLKNKRIIGIKLNR